MTYNETINWLYEQLPVYQKEGATAYKKDLTNIKLLCEALDNPQSHFKSIHVAGTNGKGSTSHLIASVLQSAGYKVGLYTSPHYVDFRERIKINGKLANKKFVVKFVKNNLDTINKVMPSFFEITVAMAFQYFKQKKVDIAVIETGLGGRLDSTNIINPLISVITNISFDHTNLLGNTLKEIAFEKAGIIKENTPTLLGENIIETLAVFKQQSSLKNSTLHLSDSICSVTALEQKKIKTVYLITNKQSKKSFRVKTNFIGPYQAKNIQTAFAALKLLPQLGLKNKHYKNGLIKVVKQTNFKGRFQVVSKKPTIILDAAHNKAGLQNIFDFVKKLHPEKTVLVLGFVKDKNVNDILKILPPNVKIMLTEPTIFRKLSAIKLYTLCRQQNLSLPFVEKNSQIFSQLQLLPNDFTVIITGSSFLVADYLSKKAQ